MLLSEGRHFIGVYCQFLLGLLVTDDRLHGLLFVLDAVFAIEVISLNVHNARVLVQLPTDLVFVQTRCPVIGLHLWKTATFGSGLRNRALPILIVLEFDAQLLPRVLIGVWRDFRYFLYCKSRLINKKRAFGSTKQAWIK